MRKVFIFLMISLCCAVLFATSDSDSLKVTLKVDEDSSVSFTSSPLESADEDFDKSSFTPIENGGYSVKVGNKIYASVKTNVYSNFDMYVKWTDLERDSTADKVKHTITLSVTGGTGYVDGQSGDTSLTTSSYSDKILKIAYTAADGTSAGGFKALSQELVLTPEEDYMSTAPEGEYSATLTLTLNPEP